jgi:hypothetical protein
MPKLNVGIENPSPIELYYEDVGAERSTQRCSRSSRPRLGADEWMQAY